MQACSMKNKIVPFFIFPWNFSLFRISIQTTSFTWVIFIWFWSIFGKKIILQISNHQQRTMRQQGSHHRLYAMVVVISFMMLVCDGCRCQRFTFDQFKCDCYQSGDGCSGSGGCTYDPWVCDGSNNCGDWSDEKYCLNTKLYCRNDECVKNGK